MLQSTALDFLKSGHNVFITGSAGAGKSYTINAFISELKKNNVDESAIAITASTGIAATHIGGTTIHSFSCMGIREEITDNQLRDMSIKRRKAFERIKEAKILIIDEISMIHRKQFELASKIISYARCDSRPFGGLQVILIGDFYQLPPVQKNTELVEDINTFNRARFCFMSPVWVNLNLKVCYLTEQHRTIGNSLNGILNALRDQSINEDHVEELSTRRIPPPNSEMLHLYTNNQDVDFINYNKLQSLPGEVKRFTASTVGNEKAVKALSSTIIAPSNLELKIGAKVIFVKNNPDELYANGSQGVVIGFELNSEHVPPCRPIVEKVDGTRIIVPLETWELTDNGKIIAEFKQFPLKLAWAITIHKSQGMSLDEAVVNLSRVFEPGMGYVALSRLRDINGLYIEDISNSAFELNPLAIKADARFRELSEINETEHFDWDKKVLEKSQISYIKNLAK